MTSRTTTAVAGYGAGYSVARLAYGPRLTALEVLIAALALAAGAVLALLDHRRSVNRSRHALSRLLVEADRTRRRLEERER